MWSLVASMAAQPLVAMGVGPTGGGAADRMYTQYNYDFQPLLASELSTIEAGLAQNNDVEAKAGDMVYDIRRQSGCAGRGS